MRFRLQKMILVGAEKQKEPVPAPGAGAADKLLVF